MVVAAHGRVTANNLPMTSAMKTKSLTIKKGKMNHQQEQQEQQKQQLLQETITPPPSVSLRDTTTNQQP